MHETWQSNLLYRTIFVVRLKALIQSTTRCTTTQTKCCGTFEHLPRGVHKEEAERSIRSAGINSSGVRDTKAVDVRRFPPPPPPPLFSGARVRISQIPHHLFTHNTFYLRPRPRRPTQTSPSRFPRCVPLVPPEVLIKLIAVSNQRIAQLQRRRTQWV